MKKEEKFILVFIVALIAFTFWITAPSEADLKQCVKATGWTKERCQVELTR